MKDLENKTRNWITTTKGETKAHHLIIIHVNEITNGERLHTDKEKQAQGETGDYKELDNNNKEKQRHHRQVIR